MKQHFESAKPSVRESAGGIVVNPEGKIALVFQHNNSWSFPKGGVENDETLEIAARREIFEETGLENLEFISELGSYERYSIGRDGVDENKEWGMRKRTMFLFRTSTLVFPELFQSHDPDGEITDAKFISIDEALALLTHPKRPRVFGIRSR